MSNSHDKQTDASTTFARNCSNNTSSTPIDGGQNISLHINTCLNMAAEETGESKSASAWSVISNLSAPSSGKQGNSPASCHNNDGRKPDPISSCRIFGFDLKLPSASTLFESPLKSVDMPNDAGEVYIPSSLSSGDSELKSGVSNDFKDLKQEQLHGLTKEVQNRQSNSSRSRTKVYDE